MKAIVYRKNALRHPLRLEEVLKPAPGDGEVLVRVYASAVNFATLIFVRGSLPTRLVKARLIKRGFSIPGGEIAGRVEAVGGKVVEFRPGDEVYGDLCTCGYGALAEYVCAPEAALAPRPANVSFEEAAAVPQSALVALQALRAGRVGEGRDVLIYGASGGIGTFAVQIAKAFGAKVTGVCGGGNLEMVRSLGADHVIDYTKEDFTTSGQRYDLIVGIRGYRAIKDYFGALTPTGVYVMIGGSWRQIFQAGALASRTSQAANPHLGRFTYAPNRPDLLFMKELIETGSVRPVIDRVFPLSQAPEAFRHFGKGHARGRVVVSMADTRAAPPAA